MNWFHKHRFEVIASHQATVTYTSDAVMDSTVVLLKCRCYAFHTEIVDGCWTLEQLQAQR